MIILNTPHNPIGKVFTREELEGIAKIVKEHDLLVLSDEVYETLIYPDSISKHVSIGPPFISTRIRFHHFFLKKKQSSPPFQQLAFPECLKELLPLEVPEKPSLSL